MKNLLERATLTACSEKAAVQSTDAYRVDNRPLQPEMLSKLSGNSLQTASEGQRRQQRATAKTSKKMEEHPGANEAVGDAAEMWSRRAWWRTAQRMPTLATKTKATKRKKKFLFLKVRIRNSSVKPRLGNK